MTWSEHVNKWKDCQLCPLGQQRGCICLARGRLPADILFVGEAPGTTEDAVGQPFVGPAGNLLNGIISRAVLPAETWVMTNLVACFPREAKGRGENEPEYGEILACRPRLIEFVNLAMPRLIVRVGKLAVSYMNFDTSIPFADIDHPAYILRLPLAQRSMASQRAVVILTNAIDDMLRIPRAEWKPWGEDHAEGTTKRDQLRKLYKQSDSIELCPFCSEELSYCRCPVRNPV